MIYSLPKAFLNLRKSIDTTKRTFYYDKKGGIIVTQKEKMKKDLLEEINGYFMQLVYMKDLINVSEDVDKYENLILH